ncbi:MAG: universal stress protein [Verrucomicrobia bacterium]|nr:universal stress protein [Verrucomicrobiota bacterium]
MNDLLQEAREPQTIPLGADLGIKKILVAVDLSPHSEKTAAYAAELAAPFGASVALIQVCSPKDATEVTDRTESRFGDPLIAPEEELGNLTKKIRKTYPSCSGYLVVGDPAEKIVLMAETLRADLIVIGSYHQRYLGQLLGLDQPSRIVHHARCPVLIYNGSE